MLPEIMGRKIGIMGAQCLRGYGEIKKDNNNILVMGVKGLYLRKGGGKGRQHGVGSCLRGTMVMDSQFLSQFLADNFIE